MGKKKGVSLEEKRERMQDLFHETKDIFTMKQLESVCSKKKGIVSQTVKDVAVGLVSDDLVRSDKIGINVFYWSFPSESLIVRENKMAALDIEIAQLEEKIETKKQKIVEAVVGKEKTDERDEALQEQKRLQKENAVLKATCSKFASLDPEFLEEQKKNAKVAFESANRWTDNIFALRSYCTKERSIPEPQFDQYFEVPADFDYIP